MGRIVRGIFFRHVLREIALATVAVALILLILLLTNQLAFVLGRAAEGQIPARLVFELMALSLRENAMVILPISLLLGVILGLGRLYHDSEIAAAQACGIGTRTLFLAAGTVTVLATAISGWISFKDGPEAAARSTQIRLEALRTAVTRGLVPGQFRSLGSGATLYFARQDPDGTMRDVFVQHRIPDEEQMEIVLADRASYSVSGDSSVYQITLVDGESYTGVPGGGAWRTVRFREQVVRVPTPQASLPGKPPVDVLPTSELMKSDDPRMLGELQWRIASVVITLALGLMAVPLARLRPRQGRYARVIWGVLLYAVYANLLIASRTMLERGDSPAWLGLWWAHALAIGLGLVFIYLPEFRDLLARRRATFSAAS
jgi:lipopolysaccharide export system permease protein